MIDLVLTAVQRDLSRKNCGAKFDVYYREGKGALFVPEGAELTHANVILAIPEIQLQFMAVEVSV